MGLRQYQPQFLIVMKLMKCSSNRTKATEVPRKAVSQQSTRAQVHSATKQAPAPLSRPSSTSVTLEERVRYQRIVLGMTDEQIARALPPGVYDVHRIVDILPSDQGDLRYAYLA